MIKRLIGRGYLLEGYAKCDTRQMRRAKNGSGSEKGKCDSPKIEGGTDSKKCDGGCVVLSYYMVLSSDKYKSTSVLQVV